MTDEPIHVKVARALGWTDIRFIAPTHPTLNGYWQGKPPGTTQEWTEFIPRFDIETRHQGYEDYVDGWAAVGPLIDRYGIGLMRDTGERHDPPWEAVSYGPGHAVGAFGATPLIAVCRLLLDLAARGKLTVLPSPQSAASAEVDAR